MHHFTRQHWDFFFKNLWKRQQTLILLLAFLRQLLQLASSSNVSGPDCRAMDFLSSLNSSSFSVISFSFWMTSSVFLMSLFCSHCIFIIISYRLGSLPWMLFDKSSWTLFLIPNDILIIRTTSGDSCLKYCKSMLIIRKYSYLHSPQKIESQIG